MRTSHTSGNSSREPERVASLAGQAVRAFGRNEFELATTRAHGALAELGCDQSEERPYSANAIQAVLTEPTLAYQAATALGVLGRIQAKSGKIWEGIQLLAEARLLDPRNTHILLPLSDLCVNVKVRDLEQALGTTDPVQTRQERLKVYRLGIECCKAVLAEVGLPQLGSHEENNRTFLMQRWALGNQTRISYFLGQIYKFEQRESAKGERYFNDSIEASYQLFKAWGLGPPPSRFVDSFRELAQQTGGRAFNGSQADVVRIGLRYLGEAYDGLGDAQSALALYRVAREFFPQDPFFGPRTAELQRILAAESERALPRSPDLQFDAWAAQPGIAQFSAAQREWLQQAESQLPAPEERKHFLLQLKFANSEQTGTALLVTQLCRGETIASYWEKGTETAGLSEAIGNIEMLKRCAARLSDRELGPRIASAIEKYEEIVAIMCPEGERREQVEAAFARCPWA